MKRKSLLSGKKFNGRHTTYLDDAKSLLEALKNSELVTKIIIGEIKRLKVVPQSGRKIKCDDVPAGIKLTFRGINGRQVFFVYTSERGQVIKIIQEALILS